MLSNCFQPSYHLGVSSAFPSLFTASFSASHNDYTMGSMCGVPGDIAATSQFREQQNFAAVTTSELSPVPAKGNCNGSQTIHTSDGPVSENGDGDASVDVEAGVDDVNQCNINFEYDDGNLWGVWGCDESEGKAPVERVSTPVAAAHPTPTPLPTTSPPQVFDGSHFLPTITSSPNRKAKHVPPLSRGGKLRSKLNDLLELDGSLQRHEEERHGASVTDGAISINTSSSPSQHNGNAHSYYWVPSLTSSAAPQRSSDHRSQFVEETATACLPSFPNRLDSSDDDDEEDTRFQQFLDSFRDPPRIRRRPPPQRLHLPWFSVNSPTASSFSGSKRGLARSQVTFVDSDRADGQASLDSIATYPQ